MKPVDDPCDHAVAQELADCCVVIVVHVALAEGGGDVVCIAPQAQAEGASLAAKHEVAILAEGRLGLQAGAGQVREDDSEKVAANV